MRVIFLIAGLMAKCAILAPMFIGALLLPTVAVGQNRLPSCPNDHPMLSWNNCQGTLTFANGEKYVGQFKDGKFDGQGTYTWAGGDKYVGQFKDGMRNGQGTHTFANGEKYVGQFKDHKYDGQGTLYAANGSIISSGIWADDKFIGWAADQETIRMKEKGGVYVVPVRIELCAKVGDGMKG